MNTKHDEVANPFITFTGLFEGPLDLSQGSPCMSLAVRKVYVNANDIAYVIPEVGDSLLAQMYCKQYSIIEFSWIGIRSPAKKILVCGEAKPTWWLPVES